MSMTTKNNQQATGFWNFKPKQLPNRYRVALFLMFVTSFGLIGFIRMWIFGDVNAQQPSSMHRILTLLASAVASALLALFSMYVIFRIAKSKKIIATPKTR